MATIKDKSTLMPDAVLGWYEFDLNPLIATPGLWNNAIVQLKDEHGVDGKNGTFYLLI